MPNHTIVTSARLNAYIVHPWTARGKVHRYLSLKNVYRLYWPTQPVFNRLMLRVYVCLKDDGEIKTRTKGTISANLDLGFRKSSQHVQSIIK